LQPPHTSIRRNLSPSRLRRVLPTCLAALGLCLSLDRPLAAQETPDIARSVCGALGAQGRLMWIDGTANIVRTVHEGGQDKVVDYSTTRAGVAAIVRHCKEAHINTLVVDIKPLVGEVLYNSKIAPHMRQYKGHSLPDFDVLAAFVEEGHRAGLLVDASVNVLSEGHKYYNAGPAYAHPDWQSIVFTVDRGLIAPNGRRLPVRVPNEPSDATRPILLADNSSIQGSEPTGSIGLETTGSDLLPHGDSGAQTLIGKQLNVVMDGDNHVTGVVDSGLLGDDALAAPEDGRLLTVTRPADFDWVNHNIRPGANVRFDMQTALTPIAQAPSEKVACFVNALNPDVRRYELDMVREIVANYDIDGFVLDRCRYSNIYNDFSTLSRDAFLRWLNTKPGAPAPHGAINWPQDVFRFPTTPGGDLIQGPLYGPWLEFRAQVIRDFVADIARVVRAAKPGIAFGTYVGSWYPAYFGVGVNWGSENTTLRYPWFTPDYPQTGYAEFFDWISTGCYYPTPTRYEAREQGLSDRSTVEYAAQLSNAAVANGAFVYPGVNVPDYVGKPEALLRALQTAGKQGQGWMIFDLSYIDEFNWWPQLTAAYPTETSPPDRVTGLLSAMRGAMSEGQ
jgi:uncharacterized lipoprotein YddW (UPF0748 family)